jgi:divalent metal cation (Fe/Co/Zn/Cd) transporter
MDEKELLHRKALRLEYFTVGYNAFEAIASIIAGKIAGSISLVGFGLDSIVESLSGLVMIWRLRKHGRIDKDEEERIERRAKKFVGLTFFLLALYVLVESVRKIVLRQTPDPSIPGIVIAVLSLIIMPLLAGRKMNIGKEIKMGSLIADAKETVVCSFLSLALLIGLVTRMAFDFRLADPIVGLIIVVYLLKEGCELLFEQEEEDEDKE